MSAKGSLILAVAFAVSCGASFWGGWIIQGTRWAADVATLKATHAEVLKAQADKALQDYQAMEKQKDEAIEQYRKASEADRLAAASAKRAADRLRKQLNAVPSRIATATEAALREYASTSSELLGNCTDEYRSMAETAQRHATDVRLLLEAWPKGQP